MDTQLETTPIRVRSRQAAPRLRANVVSTAWLPRRNRLLADAEAVRVDGLRDGAMQAPAASGEVAAFSPSFAGL